MKSTVFEVLSHPTHSRHAVAEAGGDLTGAFALFVELKDAFAHNHRYGFHAHTVALQLKQHKLYHLWK